MGIQIHWDATIKKYGEISGKKTGFWNILIFLK